LKYSDKAVKSVPKPVTNISEHLKSPLSIEQFIQKVMDHILVTHNDAVLYEFSEEDLNAIQKIRDEKYATWEWNFGRSPNYILKKEIKTGRGNLEMNLEVEKGIIKKVKINIDFFNEKNISDMENALINIPHEESRIREALGRYPIEEYLSGITADDLVNGMF
ncbi:MAG: lipoate protein ligase C-terminal domain-containing protein, partial [Ginsengibacter sp.]